MCGSRPLVSSYHLKMKRSCGCVRAPRKHGFGAKDKSRRPPEYSVWMEMKKRCANRAYKRFADYGGRGIRVCERWMGFAEFYKDMGPRPSSDHQIDRINNDGNYEPGNCRWATRVEQGRNKRNNVTLTHDGRTTNIADWSRATRLTQKQIQARIKLGWADGDVLTVKLRPDRRRATF